MVAPVSNGCYETIGFLLVNAVGRRLAEKCGFDEGTLNLLITLMIQPVG